jgi:hypothetical protein
MARLVLTLGLMVVCGLPALAQEGAKKQEPSAADLLAKGLAQAQKEEKRVFLIFGSPGCGWCKLFDKYHADPEVSKVLGKHLVLVKVDIVNNPGGEEMYKKYGTDRGVPAFTILGTDSKVLADSGDGKENIGFPAEPEEITRYFQALRKTCPQLTETEIALLTSKLKEVHPKK